MCSPDIAFNYDYFDSTPGDFRRHFAWRGGSIGVNLEAAKPKIFARSDCFAILYPMKIWFGDELIQSIIHSFTQSFNYSVICLKKERLHILCSLSFY